jgi:hypothetical protein
MAQVSIKAGTTLLLEDVDGADGTDSLHPVMMQKLFEVFVFFVFDFIESLQHFILHLLIPFIPLDASPAISGVPPIRPMVITNNNMNAFLRTNINVSLCLGFGDVNHFSSS